MCQIAAGPAAHIAHRIGSVSQLIYPRFGAVGSAMKTAAVSLNAFSTPAH